jgi:hypothetical protein
MKKVLTCLMILISSAVYAQSRDDMLVFVHSPTGGTAEQQSFFEENFKMEIKAAGYALANSQAASDFYFTLNITDNEYYQDYIDNPDGFDEPEQKHIIIVILYDNKDQREILQLGFDFTEVEEMYKWNLYLIYQAMANVPLTKLTGEISTDHWRNKWLYLSPYLSYSLHVYDFNGSSGLTWNFNAVSPIGGGLDIEFHFLNFLSVETGVDLTFENFPEATLHQQSTEAERKKMAGDVSSATIAIPLLVKYVWKPSKHFMLEPYVGARFNLSIARDNIILPPISALGGVQWGIKLGKMGGIFLDTRFGWDLGRGDIVKYESVDMHRYTIDLSIGYKIGFFNRLKEVDLEP